MLVNVWLFHMPQCSKFPSFQPKITVDGTSEIDNKAHVCFIATDRKTCQCRL